MSVAGNFVIWYRTIGWWTFWARVHPIALIPKQSKAQKTTSRTPYIFLMTFSMAEHILSWAAYIAL
ncbi:hypothetical protein EV421DRAFT_1806254 [Armillaria borealis]|uniref:Uncharacterized protein n=1 Tax=Armillaria borealis TaxID=47425 RepID=A0AA39MQT1_9AGAR|nr:hypothetical protein EV421DRAFT_1806254 [Armillaria borealis]